MTATPKFDTFTPKFGGICKFCKGSYAAGTVIAKVAGTKKKWTYAHEECAAKHANTPAPEPVAPVAIVPPPTAPVTTLKPEVVNEVLMNAVAQLRADVADLKTDMKEHNHDMNVDISDDLKPLNEKLASLEELVTKLAKRPVGNTGPLEITINKTPAVKFDKETVHEKFADILTAAATGMPVLKVGPSGSGKSHIGEQLAKALKRSFGFISCSAGMSEGQLLGRLLPVGKNGQFEFVTTEFIRCYEEGGVFMFDEIDAADPNTLVVLHSALSNGHIALPSRPAKPVAKRHKDFVCIAAANTFGTGANRQYVGRNQLDEATLDRFRIATFVIDYDEALEAKLCPDDQLRTMLQSARSKMMSLSIRRIISTRFMKDAYVMKKAAGWDDARILSALTAGWTADEISRVFAK